MTTKTEEYDRRKNEAALLRAKLGLKANGSVGIPGRAALAAHMDAKADGASDEEAFEAAKAALAEFGAAGAPGMPTASDIARAVTEETRKAAREEAEERRKAKAKEEAERIAAEREHYGVGQATPTASDNGTAAHAADDAAEAALWPTKDTPKPTEKAPNAAKMTPASAPTPADVDDALLLRLDDDDAGNADALEARHGGSFAYVGALGWLRYTGRFYDAEGAEAAVNLAAKDTLRARRVAAVKAGKREALIAAAKPSNRNISAAVSVFRDMRTVSDKRFDTERHLLNCANGVLNLKSGKLEAHEPSQLFTYCIPTEYDEHASRDEVLAFLRGSIDGDEELIWLQTWAGYCLTGETNLDEFLYIHGPTRSGKGTFTGALRALLGHPLSAEIGFSTLTAKREGDTQNFDLAPLRPARLVVCEESNPRDFINSSLVKRLTGGNAIRASFKHRDAMEYDPLFKLINISNYPIRADADDGALWARVRVAEFPHSHAKSEDYNLREHMKRPEALRAWLALYVDGAKRYYEFKRRGKGIPTPASVLASTAAARQDLDTLGQWLEERTIRKADAWTPNDLAHADYAAWCGKNGAEPKLMKSFTATLRAKGFDAGKLDRHAGEVKRGTTGLALKT